MDDKKLIVIDTKSLLQTNATILAGALIFLTLNEKLTPLTTGVFLIGTYLIVASILFCLQTTSKHPVSANSKKELCCLSGVVLLFAAITIFLMPNIVSGLI